MVKSFRNFSTNSQYVLNILIAIVISTIRSTVLILSFSLDYAYFVKPQNVNVIMMQLLILKQEQS